MQDSFTDSRDGKEYKTVKIGTQIWMAENLSYDVEGSKSYDNSPANCAKYGRLYIWEAAMAACPIGWHVPTKAEWMQLLDFAGGSLTAGAKLKAMDGWKNDGNGTDDYGFSALPSGSGTSDGYFSGAGGYGNWWSATERFTSYAYRWYMGHSYASVLRSSNYKTNLFSVRCIQDLFEMPPPSMFF
jgi:uncharacterized protein (TIGR02145 family)